LIFSITNESLAAYQLINEKLIESEIIIEDDMN
jgi:hypothetical protein